MLYSRKNIVAVAIAALTKSTEAVLLKSAKAVGPSPLWKSEQTTPLWKSDEIRAGLKLRLIKAVNDGNDNDLSLFLSLICSRNETDILDEKVSFKNLIPADKDYEKDLKTPLVYILYSGL